MIGLTLGLITVLLIVQVMTAFQGSRNTVVTGASAQEDGLVALQLIGDDISAAGAGLYAIGANTKSIFSCTNVCSYDHTNGSGSGGCSNTSDPAAVPAVFVGNAPIAAISGQALTGAGYVLTTPFLPIVIEEQPVGINGVIAYAPGSNVITLRNSMRFIGSVPATVTAAVDMTQTTLGVARTFGFAVDDLAVVTDGTNCTLFQITAVDTAGRTLSHTGGTQFNPPSPAWSSMTNGVNYASTSSVYSVGNISNGAISAREYSLAGPNGGSLQLREFKKGTANTAPILQLSDNIVVLKAQYGIAASPTSPIVVSWVGSDSATWNSWKPGKLFYSMANSNDGNIARIRSIRILIVARSSNLEAGTVTPSCSTAGFQNGPCPSGGSSQADTTLPSIDFSTQSWAASNQWQRYRYKIYKTAVPLRNVLWAGSWSNKGE